LRIRNRSCAHDIPRRLIAVAAFRIVGRGLPFLSQSGQPSSTAAFAALACRRAYCTGFRFSKTEAEMPRPRLVSTPAMVFSAQPARTSSQARERRPHCAMDILAPRCRVAGQDRRRSRSQHERLLGRSEADHLG
jgi:hypothetical protein